MDDITPQTLSSLLRVNHRFDGLIITPLASDLNIMHWNINRLKNKVHKVEHYIASFPGILHIIAISETWLTTENCSSIQLRDYQGTHSVRPKNEGGGISIFVHNDICIKKPKVLADYVSPELNHFLVVEIPSVGTTVAVPYRKGNINAFLNELADHCLDRSNCIVMGDLNLDQLTKVKNQKLADVLELNGFGLLNEISKRAVTRTTSGTILDLAITNMLQYDYKLSIVHNQSSDHSIIFTSFNKNVQTTARCTRKRKLNIDAAIQRVIEIQPSAIKCGDDLNRELVNIVHDCTSELKIKSDHRIIKSHVNREIILAIRERDRTFALLLLHPDNSLIKRRFNELSDFVDRRNEHLKAAFDHERIESAAGDARKTWKLYKEVLFNQKQSKQDSSITINGVPQDGSSKSCDIINQHFCSAGEKLATDIISVNGYSVNE